MLPLSSFKCFPYPGDRPDKGERLASPLVCLCCCIAAFSGEAVRVNATRKKIMDFWSRGRLVLSAATYFLRTVEGIIAQVPDRVRKRWSGVSLQAQVVT